MKNLFVFFFLLLSMNSFAQEKVKSENVKFLKIQGGYFYELKNAVKYTGFNFINLGLFQLDGKKIKGVDLELMGYESFRSTNSFDPGSVKRLGGAVSAFQMLPLLGAFKNGLYAGPMLSLSGTFERYMPVSGFSSMVFPKTEQRLGVGAGFKAEYYLSLFDKLSFTVGTKITLLNFGLSKGRTENPVLPLRQQRNGGFDFNFWDNYYPLMMGLSFKLG